jgi:transposase
LGAACPDLSHWADATGFVQRSRRQIVGEHPSVRRGGNSNACRRKSNSSSRSQGGAQSSLADLFQCESPVAGKTIDMLNALPARV